MPTALRVELNFSKLPMLSFSFFHHSSHYVIYFNSAHGEDSVTDTRMMTAMCENRFASGSPPFQTCPPPSTVNFTPSVYKPYVGSTLFSFTPYLLTMASVRDTETWELDDWSSIIQVRSA